MVSESIIPKRWHVYVVDLEPRIGTKPGKRRPCLAVQPTEFGESGLRSTAIIPLTTQLAADDAFPLRVRVPSGSCLLDRESDLLIDQILAWDNGLFREDLGSIPIHIQEQVLEAIRDFLDLS